jgi:hypothetical protein
MRRAGGLGPRVTIKPDSRQHHPSRVPSATSVTQRASRPVLCEASGARSTEGHQEAHCATTITAPSRGPPARDLTCQRYLRPPEKVLQHH